MVILRHARHQIQAGKGQLEPSVKLKLGHYQAFLKLRRTVGEPQKEGRPRIVTQEKGFSEDYVFGFFGFRGAGGFMTPSNSFRTSAAFSRMFAGSWNASRLRSK